MNVQISVHSSLWMPIVEAQQFTETTDFVNGEGCRHVEVDNFLDVRHSTFRREIEAARVDMFNSAINDGAAIPTAQYQHTLLVR